MGGGGWDFLLIDGNYLHASKKHINGAQGEAEVHFWRQLEHLLII